MAKKTPEELTYLAKLSEQSERYEAMVEHMTALVEENKKLSEEERNLLSVAYKNVIGAKRSAWRIVSSIGMKADSDDSKAEATKEYRLQIEKELDDTCNDVILLLDKHLIKSSEDTESKVFYLKMRGDYYRYLAEFKDVESRKEFTKMSLKSYEEAVHKANCDEDKLPSTHPIRLGLALNFSVFYYEILNDPTRACELAKETFDEAISDLNPDSQGNTYKDSTLIMQLLRDNLTLWTSESCEDDDTRLEDVQ